MFSDPHGDGQVDVHATTDNRHTDISLNVNNW